MANEHNDNQERAAGFKVFLDNLGGFLPAKLSASIAAKKATYDKHHAEREKWTYPVAFAEMHRRRSLATGEATDEDVALMMSETSEQLMKRYEDKAATMHVVLNDVKKSGASLMAEIWEVLELIINTELLNIEESARATATKYGAAYEPKRDQILNSIRRFAEGAKSRLLNPSGCDYGDLATWLNLSPKNAGGGFFSNF